MLLLLVVKREERSPDEPVPCSSSNASTLIPHYLGWLYWVADVSLLACFTFADHIGNLDV